MSAAVDAPSVIERPLGATENLYWLLDTSYCLNFVVFAEVQGRLRADGLTAALAAVQAENPLLRACVESVGLRRWFRPVPQAVAPLRLEVRQLASWRSALEGQLHAPFDTRQAPLARCLWFQGARQSVVALSFHHAIADGRSGASVLLDLLSRAASAPRSIITKPARPSAQELDPARPLTNLASAAKQAKFWLQRGSEALLPAEQLPGYDPSPAADRDVRALHYEVDSPTLAALLARAREQGTTLHGALGAAQLFAVNAQFPDDRPRRLGLNSLADLRGSLDGGLTDADLGLYIATLCTVHTLPGRASFWTLAREIRDALRATVDAGNANRIHDVYPAGLALPPGGHFANWMQAVVAAAPSSTMLTNVGRIAPVELGDGLALKSLSFFVAPPAQHPICVTATGYDGRLVLQLLSDRLKVSTRQSGEIGQAMLAQLSKAAGR